MGTLSVAHLYRQITNYGVHAVDFSGWVTNATKMSFTCVAPFATLEKRSGLEPKFVSQCISGIVIWDVLVSGFSLSLVTVPEVFAKDHSPQFRKSLNNNDRDQVLWARKTKHPTLFSLKPLDATTLLRSLLSKVFPQFPSRF